MKKLHKILLLLLCISCSTNDDENTIDPCKLKSYKTVQLYFEYFDRQDLGVRFDGFDPNFEGIQLEYDSSNRIVKVIGGPRPFPMGSNQIGWFTSALTQYDLVYSQNNINITSVIESFYGDTTNDYTIEDSKIVERSIIIQQGLLNEKVNFTYQYQGNAVLEYKEEDLYRTFYFENNNLVKIEELIYHDMNNPLQESDILYAKYEIVFSEFDNLQNLLEGKFFIDGAFFKSFSKNNYHKIELVYYTYNQETEEFERDSMNTNLRSFSFGTYEDGSSGLFVTECLELN
jgi:hypothetical protein